MVPNPDYTVFRLPWLSQATPAWPRGLGIAGQLWNFESSRFEVAGAISRKIKRLVASMKMKEHVLVALCGAALVIGAANTANAQVVVRIGPPPAAVVERPGPPLHAGWVWIPGYYRWDGHRYIWRPGYWARPPRPHAVWVPGRWVPRGGGWVWVRGYWR
jgi:WXXGXW repeat (2 copies)